MYIPKMIIKPVIIPFGIMVGAFSVSSEKIRITSNPKNENTIRLIVSWNASSEGAAIRSGLFQFKIAITATKSKNKIFIATQTRLKSPNCLGLLRTANNPKTIITIIVNIINCSKPLNSSKIGIWISSSPKAVKKKFAVKKLFKVDSLINRCFLIENCEWWIING